MMPRLLTPQEVIAWVNGLPTMRIHAVEFTMLPEYSASLPTGIIPGKRWKCLLGVHDFDWCRAGGKPRWIIREYVLSPRDPNTCNCNQYRPIIIVPAGTKP